MNNHEQLFALLDVSPYQYQFVDVDGDIIKVWCDSPTLLVKDTSTKVVIMATGYGIEWNESLLGVENASSVLAILSAYFEEDETIAPPTAEEEFEDFNPSRSNYFNWFGRERGKE